MGTTRGNSGGWKIESGETVISNQISGSQNSKIEKRKESQDAALVPGSLHCAARRAGKWRGRENRAAPVGMTIVGWGAEKRKDNAEAQSTQRFAEKKKAKRPVAPGTESVPEAWSCSSSDAVITVTVLQERVPGRPASEG